MVIIKLSPFSSFPQPLSFPLSPASSLRSRGSSDMCTFPLPFPESPSHKYCELQTCHISLLPTQALFPCHQSLQYRQKHLWGSRSGAWMRLRWGKALLPWVHLEKITEGKGVRCVSWVATQTGAPVAWVSDRRCSTLTLRLLWDCITSPWGSVPSTVKGIGINSSSDDGETWYKVGAQQIPDPAPFPQSQQGLYLDPLPLPPFRHWEGPAVPLPDSCQGSVRTGSSGLHAGLSGRAWSSGSPRFSPSSALTPWMQAHSHSLMEWISLWERQSCKTSQADRWVEPLPAPPLGGALTRFWVSVGILSSG